MKRLQPFECWKAADGDPEKYRQLMIEHGHLVKREPPTVDELCAICTKPFILHRECVVASRPTPEDQPPEQMVYDHSFKRLPESTCGQLILTRNTQRRREAGRQRD